MSSNIDNQFLRRISALEDEILRNCVDDPSFKAFNLRWVTLVNDLKAAMDAELLSSFTITTAHVLAQRVALIVQTFWDLDVLSQKLMASLLNETTTTDCSHDTPARTEILQSLPSYIKPSYDWLVDNVHNPYPSRYVRDVIARNSGAMRKDVDNWFIDARKRIGWNDARKTHFSNKRANIVDAATRFYASDEKLSLSPGAEHALISMVKNVKDLYSDKLNETTLAAKLDAVVKDLTPETKAEAKTERMRQLQLKKAKDSYPSPDRSPEPTHLQPLDEEEETVIIQPMAFGSRKRRSVSTEAVEFVQNDEHRSGKRLRSGVSPSSIKGVICCISLPSPTSSVDESFQVTDATSPSSPLSGPVSHKRRLSESDSGVVTKRPRHRPQTVSDPLSLSTDVFSNEISFDGWFQQIFDRAEVGESSPPGFVVELGSLSDFVCETPAQLRSTSSEFSGQISEVPTLEVADIPTLLDMSWNECDFGWTDKLSLPPNNLRQPDSLVNSVGQEPLPRPLAQDLTSFQVSSQVSRPENEFESFFGLSNPSLVDPAMIPLNPTPTSHENWDSPKSPLNRTTNILQKPNAGFESINGLLPSFDFTQSADFLPSQETICLPMLSQDKTRQEKEKEFREAYEKAQRLALELQKDDLFAW